MKIGTPTPRQPRPAFTPPVVLDDLGLVRAIETAPSTDEAWSILVGGGEKKGTMVARLVAARDRCTQAMHDTAKGIDHITERLRIDPPVPASWLSRLADLHVAELEAAWTADDVAHEAALAYPDWVALPRGERPIHPSEQSWARVARLVGREIQLLTGLTDNGKMWSRLGAIDPHADLRDGDIATHKDVARQAIRETVLAVYGSGS